MPRKPQTLDCFPPIDFKVMKHVHEHGFYQCTMATKAQADDIKRRFWKLIASLKHYGPNLDITKTAARMVIRSRGNILLMELKDNEEQVALLEAGLANNTLSPFDAEERRMRAADAAIDALTEEDLLKPSDDEINLSDADFLEKYGFPKPR